MRAKYSLIFISLMVGLIACSTEKGGDTVDKDPAPQSAASIGIVGDIDNVERKTEPGIVVMGGSTDVDEAIQWMIDRSAGGDFVVIRATGTDAYNPYIYGLGELNSVETLKIDTYQLALDSAVAATIRDAEALFIAGGDQSDYVNLWQGTEVEKAINYLVRQKKVPVGGTSAGAAILGGYSFSARNGTITSKEALQNPYHPNVTLLKDDFLKIDQLANTIVDQHYFERNRQGRHIVFMSRLAQENSDAVRGLGVGEKTAVVIDVDGKARVFGDGKALFLEETLPEKNPEICDKDTPLTWSHNQRAVKGWSLERSEEKQAQFDITSWKPVNEMEPVFYYVNEGKLLSN